MKFFLITFLCVDRGMAKDFSWNASKFKYEGLYNFLIGDK